MLRHWNGVDVWRIDLELAPENRISLLTTEELDLAGRFVTLLDRKRFINRRAAVKQRLADYLSVDPLTILLTKGPHGKPRIFGHRLEFSVTSCEATSLLAICRTGPVGIDLCLTTSEVFLHPPRVLFSSKMWAAYEAMSKATGVGITAGIPSESDFELDESVLDGRYNCAIARAKGPEYLSSKPKSASAL